MNNQIKYEYAKQHWELRDGVVYSKLTGKPKTFPSKSDEGRRFQIIKVNGKKCAIYIYEALFMLHHNRAIAEGKQIHHIDGNYENNAITNLVELTKAQHMRIHAYQANNPMRRIRLYKGAWKFEWRGDDGRQHARSFRTIDEAKALRDEIEEPRRQELRALGLNCRKISRGITASELRRISRQQNTRLWRAHI